MANAACVARSRCELVCAVTPSDRKIGHAVHNTCEYVRKLREATRMRFYLLSRFTLKDRQIGRTVQ